MKSGYHHEDINPDHRQFLGFRWDWPDGDPSYYVFTVLPFGLAMAPYAFTKLLRPLVKHWRSQGLRAVVYLDDGIIMVKGQNNVQQASDRIWADLLDAGQVENSAKSRWVPIRKVKWLGFIINLKKDKQRFLIES